jgi:hypothetical protein
LRTISSRACSAAPIAALAALRAVDVRARNLGRKFSTAIALWSRTTFFALHLFASWWPFEAGCPLFGLRRAIIRS